MVMSITTTRRCSLAALTVALALAASSCTRSPGPVCDEPRTRLGRATPVDSHAAVRVGGDFRFQGAFADDGAPHR